MAKSKIYVVYVGRQPGLYETWDECRAEVEGYPGARYKSFYSKEEAVMSMRESDASASMALRQIARHLQEDTPEVVAPRTKKASPSVYPPDVILNSLAVDAGCMGNPGIMEYRGVYVQTGQEVSGERSVEKTLLVGDNIVQNAHNLTIFAQVPAHIAQGRPEPGHPVAHKQYVRPPFTYFLGGTDVCYRICRVQNCLTRNLLRGVFLRDILSLAREKQFRILS